jgi:Fic family protein
MVSLSPAPETQNIWDPESGITDFEVDPASLSASEIPGIRAVWDDQRARLKGTSQLTEFTDKLSREWAIETGIIENLYQLERGVTHSLIERGFQAELIGHGDTNKPREYVIQLLRDQQDALEGVFDFVANRRELSVSYIKELHAALLRSQATTEAVDALGRHVEVPLTRGDWKTQPNSPTRDSITFGYCPPEQVASEMDRLIALHLKHEQSGVSAEVEAAWLHHRFSQIHPFQDGNGRVARALASLVLVKGGLFPLVVTRDDKAPYLDALEAADGGNLKPLVSLIAKLQRAQFTKASAISEQILAADADIQQLLTGLANAADRAAERKRAELQRVFEISYALEDDAQKWLEAIAPTVKEALLKLDSHAECFAIQSTDTNSHYYRAQIINIARQHLSYYANTSDYRAWVALWMNWQRRAKLVFAFHGIGRPFSGSLICSPFLEFRDKDEDDETRTTLVPVAEEGFVFFYSDKSESALDRFRAWREGVLRVALKELMQNL